MPHKGLRRDELLRGREVQTNEDNAEPRGFPGLPRPWRVPWMPFPRVRRLVGQSPCCHARHRDWQGTSACMYTTSTRQHQAAHLAIPPEAPSWDDLTLFIRMDTHNIGPNSFARACMQWCRGRLRTSCPPSACTAPPPLRPAVTAGRSGPPHCRPVWNDQLPLACWTTTRLSVTQLTWFLSAG